MPTHQQSKPRAANQSIAEESERPGTCRSKVGCEAIDEPCTNRIRPAVLAGSAAHLLKRKSFTSPLRVQCSVPVRRACSFMTLPSGFWCSLSRSLFGLDSIGLAELG